MRRRTSPGDPPTRLGSLMVAMSAQPRIDGDADTMCAAPFGLEWSSRPSAPDQPSGASLTDGDSARSTERAGDGLNFGGATPRTRPPAAEDRIGDFTLLRRL